MMMDMKLVSFYVNTCILRPLLPPLPPVGWMMKCLFLVNNRTTRIRICVGVSSRSIYLCIFLWRDLIMPQRLHPQFKDIK